MTAVADDAPLRVEDDERYLTIDEAAERLRFSTKTIRRRIEDGTLATVSAFGRVRIKASELNRHIRPIHPSGRGAS
jgi:excisionase family DNA binding protein